MAKNLLSNRLVQTPAPVNEELIIKKEKRSSNKKNLLNKRLENDINPQVKTDNSSKTINKKTQKHPDHIFVDDKKNKKGNKLLKMPKTEQKTETTVRSIDDELDNEFSVKSNQEVKKYKTSNVINIAKRVGIIVSCIYFSILIFGAVITEYTYDSAGNVTAMAMSYDDLKKLDEFKILIKQFYTMQDLYKATLDIDYEFYLNPSESTALSAEYEGLLEDVSKASIKTDSINVSVAYTHIKSMMLSWIKNDIAVYLQNMSVAIAQNDTQKASNAAEDRVRMKNNYEIIFNNLTALGEKIKGMDINDLNEWNPDNYSKSLSGAE